MPFKRYMDNAIYSLIYTLMLTISVIELYAIIAEVSEMFLEAVIWMQIVLCLLPLCCCVSYCVWRLVQVLRKFFNKFTAEKVTEVSHY